MEAQHRTGQRGQPTTDERVRKFVGTLVGNWRPSGQQVLQWIRVAIVVGFVLLIVLLILYAISVPFKRITLIDLLNVLAIPITVGAAVPLLNWLQKKRELDIEHQRAQDDALQAYLDQMGQLLLKSDHSGKLLIAKRGEGDFEGEGDFISALIRSRTLTILALLDSDRPISRRKGSVLQFLYESGLIDKAPEGVVVKLYGEAKTGGPLPRTPGQSAADLSRADLRRATLSRADLSGTRLSYACLSDAKLPYTDLNNSNLYHTDLSRADLKLAELRKADLRGANLSGANLSNANLDGADLNGAFERVKDGSWRLVTNEELERQAASLKDATMPDGQKYEDWLKDRARRGENGEKGGRS